MSSSSSPASPAAGASSSAARSSRPCASSSPISRPTPRSASMASSSSSSSFDVSLFTAGSTVASVDAPTLISASPSASAGLTIIFAARRGQQPKRGHPPFAARQGASDRLRRAGSCRGGRPAWNATERAAPEHPNGHGSKDITVSLTFERPSAAEIAREERATRASRGAPSSVARRRLSEVPGAPLRPENAVARAHLLGSGKYTLGTRESSTTKDFHNLRGAFHRRVRRLCGVHRGVGRPI